MEADGRSRRQARSDHVALEIVQEDDLVCSVKEKIDSVALMHSICKVPDKHYKEHEEKYFPKFVSIGPLHHGKDPARAMEDEKWRYLNTLLNRKLNLEASLENCVKALRESEHKARRCYGEIFEVGSDEFVEMMLVDGCFIIELLLKYSFKGLRRRDDPFFATNERFFQVRIDLILLENQIPFFIVQRLFNLVPIPKHCTFSLVELALRFFKKLIPGDVPILQEKFTQDFSHLLDIVLHCYLPTFSELHSRGAQQSLARAKKLQEAGIRLEKANAESLLNIKFVNGVLKMPPLKVHDYTEVVLRNLIALEHCYCDRKKCITSYSGVMKSLLQSKDDVRLLFRKRILTNGSEKREEILELFKKLPVEMDVKDYYYNGLCEQVNSYRRTNLQAWFHKMKRTPLAMAGLILAVLFLVLTFIGALFLVLSFTHHF